MRLEFIAHNLYHTPTFELQVLIISVPGPYAPHQDWLCLDWFKPFTSAWPFQCLIMSITSGQTRIWLEFIAHNHHHTSAFESQVMVAILVPGPYVPHPDWLCLDWFKPFTSAWPFQCLIMSIINGQTRMRLGFIAHNHHHSPTFESQVVAISVPGH